MLTFKICITYLTINLRVHLFVYSLKKKNIDRLMGICLDGPKFLSEEQLEKIIDLYKEFICNLFAFDRCSLIYLEVDVEVDILLIYIILD